MKKFIFLIQSIFLTLLLQAQLQVKLVFFSAGYSSPVGIENCGDSRLFIVQQTGQIIISDSLGNRRSTPFLDLTDRISTGIERGVLGLAFDPAYKANGFFYVNYTDKNGNTQVSRFSVKSGLPNQADKNSEKLLLNIAQPFSTHNGGCTRFGPDGYLYIGMGDGGYIGDPYNNAQNKQSLLGKMLRIDVHNGNPYAIPADNPFKDSANYRSEIWALGLRNPWRWSFDAVGGSMYIADVGQDNWEEVNVQKRGKGGQNYGWRCYEGKQAYHTDSCAAAGKYIAPTYEYAHADSTTKDCSIIGGFVYRGARYPNLYGKYLFNDYCNGVFRALYSVAGKITVTNLLDADDNAFVSFGLDRNRELYVCNYINGNIYRVSDASVTAFDNVVSGKAMFSILPNPSKGNFQITYHADANTQLRIRISNNIGVQYLYNNKNVNKGDNSFAIDLKAPKGNYFVLMTNASGESFTKQLKIE